MTAISPVRRRVPVGHAQEDEYVPDLVGGAQDVGLAGKEELLGESAHVEHEAHSRDGVRHKDVS